MVLAGNDGIIRRCLIPRCGTIPHRVVAQIGVHALKIPVKALQGVTTLKEWNRFSVIFAKFFPATDYAGGFWKGFLGPPMKVCLSSAADM
jgi:hypothetical protein